MDILFILPYDCSYRYKGGFTRSISYAPLTLSTLAALVPPELNARMTLVDEGVQKPATAGRFDLVAITCTTSAANRAYALCEFWRKKGSYVVLGGAHPTFMPAEAALHADSVFVGFAEYTFPQFFRDLAHGAPQKRYDASAPGACLPLPDPRRDLISRRYMNIPTILANRGCSNHCSYCCIPRLWGGSGVARPVGEVVDEIKRLGRKRYILLDPSFSSDPEYAKELLHALIPLKITWSGLASIDIAEDDALFSLLPQSGCEGILSGFESLNAADLAQVGKKTNRVDGYRRAVRRFHAAGIPVLGCFVAGFDHDTAQSLYEMIDVIDEIGVDLPRFSVLTPFPGTPLYDAYEKQGRILTKDWDAYDTMHVVFAPRRMDADALQQTFYGIWKKAYETKRILRRIGHTRKNRALKLMANLGFQYYARHLARER
ncbi:MAG: radical SAM protein [Clostridiales Family XIII bacterium]|jgi:radical SAM superfamily enzyme YgiQ (UPF0313 family)|nr:radical SAM protein [Clostridiales Family XIII bacterium]